MTRSGRSSKTVAVALSVRQRQLLALLDALGGCVENLDFQKLLFLYCCEQGGASAYEFVPYKYGAFSFTSYADRRKLVARGLLADDENLWRFTDAGSEMLEHTRDLLLSAFARRYASLRGDELVAETYRRFPYYATRSEIANRVLQGDTAALKQIEIAFRSPSTAACLCTIGYEGRTLEGYLNVLIRADVHLLCDIRRNPISRKYGFSKRTLERACAGIGIGYEHLPELGIASDQRQGLQTDADYAALFLKYSTDDLPLQNGAIERIQHWIRSGQRVALTCYERLPQQCHRHCVSEALERALGNGIVATHL